MATPLKFKTPRELLAKASRERDRLAKAIQDGDETEIADHVFNLAVSVFSVRDWIAATSPKLEAGAFSFVKAEQSLARLADTANISKHWTLRNPPKAAPEIDDYSFTSVPSASPATLDPRAYEIDAETKEVVVTEPCVDDPALVRSPKALLVDGSRRFTIDDADAAIEAWERFLRDRDA